MNPHKFNDIFNRALDVSVAGREDFLKKECGDDDELFAKIQSLLEADSEASENSFLERPAFVIEAENLFENLNDSRIGQTVGDYKITGKLGEGGMGDVYLAARADGQIEKRAAVKIVKRGMDSEEVLRRFYRERQILANLEHSSIARLLDAGMTTDGLPFFVMELVEGLPVDEFCRRENLSLDGKLDLFREICAAIAEAHRNLIVHRDLKPSNILVCADGAPKLLDFGIAKFLNETDAEKTKTEMRVLTPAFASPEQMTGGAITTATDIYALGLILKKILLTETGEKSEKIPADLQNIIATATDEDPARRYSSAERLADDIHNFQRGLPVSARPATAFYRASKFIKRNKIATFAAISVFFALAFGVGVALYQAQIARAERLRAEQRFEETRNIAKAVIFNYYDEINKLTGATKVRSMMISDALKYLDNLANDESATRDKNLRLELAEGFLRMGDVQGIPYGDNLGDSAGALESYQKALNLLENAPAENLEFIKTRAKVFQKLALISVRQENSRDKTIEYTNRSIELLEKIAAAEPNSANKMALADGYFQLSAYIGVSGELEKSVSILQKVAAISGELSQSEPENAEFAFFDLKVNGRIAFHYSQMGFDEMYFWNENAARENYEKSVPYFERSIELAKKLSAADPENTKYPRAEAIQKSNLAEALAEIGRTDEALKLQREVLDYQKNILETDAANQEIKFAVAEDYLDLSRTLIYRGEKSAAQENFERGIKIMEELIKSDPTNSEFTEFQFANFTNYYGDAQIRTGDYKGATESYRRALEKNANYSPDSPERKKERKGLAAMRFGDIDFFKSQKEPRARKLKDLKTAREFYNESAELLNFDRSNPDRKNIYLKRKIAECEKALGED